MDVVLLYFDDLLLFGCLLVRVVFVVIVAVVVLVC